MTTITFDPAALGAEVGQFKAACVRAENASTPFARKALAGLMTGGATVSSITILLIAAFKPVSPKGKKGETLSSLRYAVGGDAARKAAEKVFTIFENVALNDDIRAAVTAFILEQKDCAKSLNALLAEVKAKVAAHNAAQGAEEAADGADDTTPEENGAPSPEPATNDLADMANRLIVAMEAADVPALASAQERLAALMAAIETAGERIASAAEETPATGTEG